MSEAKRDVASEGQRQPIPWIDAQGIALLLIVSALAFVLGSGALWIGLR
jgi:hypothetical protein